MLRYNGLSAVPRFVAFALGLVLAWSGLARAENYAFLVGVGGYDEKQLRGLGEFPRRDVIEFRDVLLESGFEAENVVLMVDDLEALPRTTPVGRYLPESARIRRELDLLLPTLEREDTLVVAFAGHGVQFQGEAEPYFCPADAKLTDKSTLLSLTWLYDQLKYDSETGKGCKPRRKLLLVDACRNDPASRTLRDAGGPRLESVSTPQLAPLPEGIVALFSCAEGQQALQHDPLKHGVFFYHVLEGWNGAADGDRDETVTLDEVIAYTKSRTATYARRELAARQTPRQKGFFEGNWNLRTDWMTGTAAGRSRVVGGDLEIDVRWCPPGSFTMGSPATESRAEDEDQVRVTLSHGYWMGRTEVTQRQFEAVMGSKPWIDHGNPKLYRTTPNHPAVYVAWHEATTFCSKLTEREQRAGRLPSGWAYRLPTEAEWEYACRAGTATAFSFGGDDSRIRDHAWVDVNALGAGEGYSHAVGTKQPNPWGLCDVHGNVFEWCSDWYAKKLVGGRDPRGARSGTTRVNRSGAWPNSAFYARSACRLYGEPASRSPSVGFRLALCPTSR